MIVSAWLGPPVRAGQQGADPFQQGVAILFGNLPPHRFTHRVLKRVRHVGLPATDQHAGRHLGLG